MKGSKSASKDSVKPRCQKKELSWVTPSYMKLAVAPVQQNFVCNKIPANGYSCCKKAEYAAIEAKWNNCQGNQYQSSFVNFMRLIIKFKKRTMAMAKRSKDNTMVKITKIKPTAKNSKATPKTPVKKTAKTTAKPKKTSSQPIKKTAGKRNRRLSVEHIKRDKRLLQTVNKAAPKKAPAKKSAAKTSPTKKSAAPKSKPTASGMKPVTKAPSTNSSGKVEITQKVQDSINRIIKGDYTAAKFGIWKTQASLCYDRLDIILKGMMCSFCTSDVNRRWADQNKVVVGEKDLHFWSKACGGYVQADIELLNHVYDIQNVLKSLPDKVKHFAKPERPLPTPAKLKLITHSIEECAESVKHCAEAVKNLSSVMSISNLIKWDLENYELVRDTASRVLNYSTKKVSGPVADKKTATPVANKKLRRLISIIKKKEAKPFNAFCQIPYKTSILVDGKMTPTSVYSPVYSITCSNRVKSLAATLDNKMISRPVTGLPKAPSRAKLHNNGQNDMTCPLAKGFGMISTKKITVSDPSKPTRFCPSIKNNCCSDHSISNFYTKWNNPDKGYMGKIKQCSEAPLYVTSYMVRWMLRGGLKGKAEINGSKWCKRTKTNFNVCLSLFNSLNTQSRAMRRNGGFIAYTKNYIECKATMNQIKTSSVCMACDYDIQKSLDTKTMSIPVTSPVLNLLVRKCYASTVFESDRLAPFYATL